MEGLVVALPTITMVGEGLVDGLWSTLVMQATSKVDILLLKVRKYSGSKPELGFYIPFNSQGHIGTGTQTHTEVTAYDWMPNLLTTRQPRTSM